MILIISGYILLFTEIMLVMSYCAREYEPTFYEYITIIIAVVLALLNIFME